MNNEQIMTNEEAIKILEVDKAYLYPDDKVYNRRAYDLAIEALKMNMDVDFDKVREQFKEADNEHIQ